MYKFLANFSIVCEFKERHENINKKSHLIESVTLQDRAYAILDLP
jgi:hypothetical protein